MVEYKPTNQVGAIIIAFITIILAVVFLGAIADNVFENRNVHTFTNDSVSVTAVRAGNLGAGLTAWDNATSVSLNNNYIRTLTEARHSNGTVLVENTDFILDYTAGTFVMLNSTTNTNWNFTLDPLNNTEWDYDHGEKYVTNAASRTLLGLVALFFALGLLAWLFFWLRNNYGDLLGF